MVQMEGTYVHGDSEGLEEYLAAIGGPEYAEAGKAFVESKPTFVFTENDGVWVTRTLMKDGKSFDTPFTPGVPYDDLLPDGAVYKSVTVIDGDKMITTTELPDGNKSIREYQFSDAGVKVRYSDKKFGVKALRYYKRV